MKYLGEVIATVVSETLGRLLTSWNMMRADAQGGKMAPDSHSQIYHHQTRQFGRLGCVTAKRNRWIHLAAFATFKGPVGNIHRDLLALKGREYACVRF